MAGCWAPADPPVSADAWRCARSRRQGAFALLVVAMLLLHLLLAERLGAMLQATRADTPPPPRLQAAFVRELQPTEPPAVAPLPAAPEPAAAARPAAPRASAPAEMAAAASAAAPSAPASAAADPVPVEAAEPSPPAEDTRVAAAEPAASPAASSEAALPDAPEPSASVPADAMAGAASAAAAAASAPAFSWPASTRLSYELGGNVRGEVHGSAQVQWVRDGAHYQVHLDVIVGPSLAPLVQRRMTSDGAITPEGLAPRRYDEETKVAFGSTRRTTVAFDADGVTLANGQRAARLAGVQDTASQFVQLTYLFSTQPQRLVPGAQIAVPLALPWRVDHWVYDVVGEEPLYTPFGVVPAWHLVPRRAGTVSVLSIEAWFAPSLQYLPVRIVIRQGPDEYVDLMIDRLPQQANDEPRSVR